MYKRLILPGFTPRFGSAARRDTGTAEGQIPLLTSTGLPAVSGAALTAAPLPRSYLAGLTLSNNGTDANNDIDIAAGTCRDSTNVANITLASAITKKLDASWAVGTDQGGLDGSESSAGTPDTSTWYHVHAILRTDTGVVDALFSESATAPTLPTDYDYFRRIGAVYNDGSGNIFAFKQIADWFLWKDPPLDNNSSLSDGVAALVTLTVPGGVNVQARLNAALQSTVLQGYISSPDQNDEEPSVSVAPLETIRSVTNGTAMAQGPVDVWTNTSSQVRARVEGANGIFYIATLGYQDRRGRDD